MNAHSRWKRLLGGLAVVLLVLIAGYLPMRANNLHWGATGAEVAAGMPGDLDGLRWTRGITIQAAPAQVWPWLAQWGQGRGGWYSYDWLENLFGFDIHTADRILPAYQTLNVGDTICMAKSACISKVSLIETNRWLSWQSLSPDGRPMWTFTLGLSPLDGSGSRLLIRESFARDAMPAPALAAMEMADVVMEQKALNTVKDRAEGRASSPLTTFVEVGVWLAALVIGGIAGLNFVTRPEWKASLAIGVVSVVVLLALTFLFPPLWLRILFDLGLFTGMLWSLQPGRGSRASSFAPSRN